MCPTPPPTHPLSLGGSPVPPFHAGAPGARRATGWAAGDAPRGANEGLPHEPSPTPFSPLCPALPLPAPSLPRRAQAALPNACWQLLPPAPRGEAAARADEMRPDGPAILYNGLRQGGSRGPGRCGDQGPPPRTAPRRSRRGPCCMRAAWQGDAGGLPAPRLQTGVRRPGRLLCFPLLAAAFSMRML